MYIIAVFIKDSDIQYLQKDKKVVENLSELCIFDVYSEAATASKCLRLKTEIYPLKEFILDNLDSIKDRINYKFAEQSA